ncbi:MAG: response regulator transcription factor, partial [Nocardioidaceae bacterium]
TDAEPSFVDDLSPRELEVLQLLVAGLSRAEVAERLVVSPNTVRTHVQNLLKAADVHSTLALVAVAREAGVEAPQ